jgi:hypothetical protein
MKKLPWWTWTLIVLIAADLGLAATGTGILIGEQNGHGWKMERGGIDVRKQKIPMRGCIYWTGLGTRQRVITFPAPGQTCKPIDR